MVIERLRREPSLCRPARVEEGIAQHLEQVAEVIVVADPARLREHPRERLLHEVLGFNTRTGQRPRSPKQAIDVVAQGAWIEHPVESRHAERNAPNGIRAPGSPIYRICRSR